MARMPSTDRTTALPPYVRASDADRERRVALLQRHCAEGRLTCNELAERVEATYAARTLGQLDRITHDLPPGGDRPMPAVRHEARPPDDAGDRNAIERWIDDLRPWERGVANLVLLIALFSEIDALLNWDSALGWLAELGADSSDAGLGSLLILLALGLAGGAAVMAPHFAAAVLVIFAMRALRTATGQARRSP